jgi:hypothetical protein
MQYTYIHIYDCHFRHELIEDPNTRYFQNLGSSRNPYRLPPKKKTQKPMEGSIRLSKPRNPQENAIHMSDNLRKSSKTTCSTGGKYSQTPESQPVFIRRREKSSLTARSVGKREGRENVILPTRPGFDQGPESMPNCFIRKTSRFATGPAATAASPACSKAMTKAYFGLSAGT